MPSYCKGEEVEDCHKFVEHNTKSIDTSYLTTEQQEWIARNGSCYFSQSVHLNATSIHFAEYEKSDFAILSVEGNALNPKRDSSKGEVDWRWDNEENWVLIGLNANKPVDDQIINELTIPDGVVTEDFSFMETIAAKTTVLAVKFSEINSGK